MRRVVLSCRTAVRAVMMAVLSWDACCGVRLEMACGRVMRCGDAVLSCCHAGLHGVLVGLSCVLSCGRAVVCSSGVLAVGLGCVLCCASRDRRAVVSFMPCCTVMLRCHAVLSCRRVLLSGCLE